MCQLTACASRCRHAARNELGCPMHLKCVAYNMIDATLQSLLSGAYHGSTLAGAVGSAAEAQWLRD